MSSLSKWFSNAANFIGNVGYQAQKAVGDVSQAFNGSRGVASYTTDKVADFYKNEIADKSDLRGAEAETFASGLPIVGGVLQGIEGVNRLEDLYDKTGKLPAYPAGQGVGAGAAGYALGHAVEKIMDGKNDLYEYYTGTPDDFRAQMNNMYG